MIKLFRLSLFLLAISCAQGVASFAHEDGDLKGDPAVHRGRLGNGIRHAVLAISSDSA